jgi:hypothetical protein
LLATTAVVELKSKKFNRIRGCKTFAIEMTPDDRGYSKFNRFRGSFPQNSG